MVDGAGPVLLGALSEVVVPAAAVVEAVVGEADLAPPPPQAVAAITTVINAIHPRRVMPAILPGSPGVTRSASPSAVGPLQTAAQGAQRGA